MKVTISWRTAILGAALALLGGARNEKIYIGDQYAGGYLVRETWGSPIPLDQGIGVALGEMFALVMVAAGLALVAALVRDALVGVYTATHGSSEA